MVEKFKAVIGAFAGILHEDGKVLVKRRTLPGEEKSLIVPEKVYGDWELPGGIVEQEEMLAAGNERGLIEAAKRETKEELGLEINPSLASPIIPVVLAKEFPGERIVNDIAFVVPIQPDQWTGKPKGEVAWVDPSGLQDLAKRPKGEQLLSGWGKRMCRMALHALCYSQKLIISNRAKNMLAVIQKEL